MATNYGITDEGFVKKRLQDIFAEQQQKATELFQDLLQPGEIVDTSTSSALGRLIALDGPGDADLWEVAQQSWSALDPNSATGISLDNIVQYGGISRFQESPSTASQLYIGDLNTSIPTGNTVKADDTNKEFTLAANVTLSPTLCSGITVLLSAIQNTTLYRISYNVLNGTTQNIDYTSDGTATASEILGGLQALIAGSHPLLVASVVDSTLVITNADVFQAITFSTSANITISKVRKVGTVICTENGANQQEANTITTIVTPVLGLDSTANPISASVGRLVETDEELRIRFRNTKLERSSNTLDSLYSAILNIDSVDEVKIYENDTSITDSNGVLGHSFLPVVLGGSSQIIAETIWENKPIGILSQGNTTISITDEQGFSHNISFKRPDPITVYIELDISLDTEATTPFPGDGVDQIKSQIISYALNNIGVGKDVVYSRLFTPINSVPGHQVNNLFIGTSPAPVGVSNIVIDFDEIASFETVNINVTIS